MHKGETAHCCAVFQEDILSGSMGIVSSLQKEVYGVPGTTLENCRLTGRGFIMDYMLLILFLFLKIRIFCLEATDGLNVHLQHTIDFCSNCITNRFVELSTVQSTASMI